MIDVTHDRDHRRTNDLRHAAGVFQQTLDGLILQLLFHSLDLRVRAVGSSDTLDQVIVERLVHGDKNTAHQKGCDQVFTAQIKLLGQILDGDALRHRDGAGDRHIAVHADLCTAKPRRWRKALHRAFFALLVALLVRSAFLGRGAHARLLGAGRTFRYKAGSTGPRPTKAGSAGTKPWARTEAGPRARSASGRSAWKRAGGMHGTARTRSTGCPSEPTLIRRTWAAGAALKAGRATGALKDGSAWCLAGRRGRRGVRGPRPGLRHDDAPHGRGGCLRHSGLCRRCGLHRGCSGSGDRCGSRRGCRTRH